MKKLPVLAAMLIAGAGIGVAAQAAPQAPKPRLTMPQARAIALKAAPGKLISGEYENEGGAWRYSFDIQQRGHVQEIGVDANSGKIVENKSEGRVDKDAEHKGR